MSEATAKPSTQLAGIAACVFDAYGTLFDVHSAVGAYRDDLGDSADAISATWRTKQLEYTWLRSLMRCHVDFWHVTGDALDYALANAGIDDPAVRARLMDAYLSLACYPEVAAALKAIKAAGMSTAILSNGATHMLIDGCKSAGISDSIDKILSVDTVGVFKPSPEVYQLAVDALGTAAPTIAFMSSNAWDIAGGAYFGLHAVWINRFGQKPERLPGTPIAVLTGLTELPALLGL